MSKRDELIREAVQFQKKKYRGLFTKAKPEYVQQLADDMADFAQQQIEQTERRVRAEVAAELDNEVFDRFLDQATRIALQAYIEKLEGKGE